LSRALPFVIRTAINDVRRARAACVARNYDGLEWTDTEIEFVWQYHDLFHRFGHGLAQRHACPLVSFVEAGRVWEDRIWGVRRPGWGGLLERLGERPQLLGSDVILCVSEEVAERALALGAEERKIVVSPNGVESDRFSPDVSGARVRRTLGLGESFVIGWTGSFRRFHGLEVAVRAFAQVVEAVRDARLLLVGDGFERSNVEQLASALGVRHAMFFTGAVSHGDVPEYVAAMDVALVTAKPGEAFHYSPLKMREYLACARAVVAPRIGDVARTLTDGLNGLLYEPGDVEGLACRILSLRADSRLRAQLGAAGRSLVVATCTRDLQLDRLLRSEPFLEASARLSSSRTARKSLIHAE
jgi:glycosyltransferase involved in cell wall biosynthesis